MEQIVTCACRYQIVRNGQILARPLYLDGRGRCPRCGRWLQLPVQVTVSVLVATGGAESVTGLEGLELTRRRVRPRRVY